MAGHNTDAHVGTARPAQSASLREAMLDRQAINLDGFCVPTPELGLAAIHSPFDPEPSLLVTDGRVVEIDGKAEADFDVIDAFIAIHGLDLEVAAEAMAADEVDVARMMVDPAVPRHAVVRLVSGMTPAKLARVVAVLLPAELQIAVAKMHVRRTPSIQAHVTNQLDDPILLAADAAAAVALGFRELETTVPVLGEAPSNAVAMLIGSQVGAPGALCQCSVEESLELALGMRGLTTYAETISIYGTEQVFVDGDDTPWSKTFLAAAYASRGMKMRVTSGAGAEVLMGAAEKCSMLYLESRCVSIARAMGSQGVQNGGIDGASIVAAVPDGMRELLAENLMVMMRDLESCSGNDTLISESDLRRSAHTLPLLLAGSDFIFSGYGSIPRYDNTFAISNFNAEDLDDYLVLQRDWGVDGGLRAVPTKQLLTLRRRAARATQAVYRELGLAEYSDAHIDAVVTANGSRDLPRPDPLVVLEAANAIQARQLTSLDVVAALARTGFTEEAEAILTMARLRLTGDHLQTAAIYDEQLTVLSKLTDPNDYTGPGSGYRPTPDRRAEIDAIRQARTVPELLADQVFTPGAIVLIDGSPAAPGSDPREVVIGLSPAFARTVWLSLCGLTVGEVLRQIEAGLEEEGCLARLVRVQSTIDVGMIGLTAARLAGSGIGVGLQGKGTALIHRRDLSPLANLELYSVAPLLDAKAYRALGHNAARHAKGMTPAPITFGGTEQAITSRYHTRSVALVSLEREQCRVDAPTIEVSRA